MIDLKDSLMTDILPGHLETAEVKALAYAVGQQIRQLCAYADKSRTYAALASAPDTVLDALAAELRTPAYDETLPVETKRELVASTLTFYTHLGTPAALEQLISILFAKGRVAEWYNYNGSEYHFKVQIDIAADAVDDAKQAQVQAWVNQYKNQRSILDTIEYYETGAEAVAFTAAAFIGCELVDSCTAENYN
jgi:phage tail P2-like protein|nr:MAG TPA: tail protein [Caudoviricetes sp.]